MLMLLAKVVVANNSDEIINSPDRKPTIPVMKAKPFNKSFCAFVMVFSNSRTHGLTIEASALINNGAKKDRLFSN